MRGLIKELLGDLQQRAETIQASYTKAIYDPLEEVERVITQLEEVLENEEHD